MRASANRNVRPKPALVAVKLGEPALVPTRRYYLRRIRWLANDWGLAWMVDQATLGHRLDSLDDNALCTLLAEMEQGRRCCVEGVGFDDAGLVRAIENR